MVDKIKANLIIIGGAEDKKGKKEILKYVCSRIDKEKDILLITAVASEYPEEMCKKYKRVFGELGIKNILFLKINERCDAYLENNVQLVNKANLIFFTGGDQLRITSLIGGSPVYSKLIELAEKGVFLVGTSAGASVMSETMIVGGDDEESPRKCSINMAPGLGFIDKIIIDQHFAQRGRIGRLFSAIAQNPQILGIGIDENTAIVVTKEGMIQIIGEGAVYFIDGSDITYTNVSEQNVSEVLSIYNIKVNVLKKGNKFNIITKKTYE